jgi:hypothetical protein
MYCQTSKIKRGVILVDFKAKKEVIHVNLSICYLLFPRTKKPFSEIEKRPDTKEISAYIEEVRAKLH